MMPNKQPATWLNPDYAYTEKLVAGIRTYTFTIKTNRAGNRYISITETHSEEGLESFNSLAVFPQHLEAFQMTWLRTAARLHPEVRRCRVEEIRKKYPRAYETWTAEEDQELADCYCNTPDVSELAQYFQRQPTAIKSRLRALGITPIRHVEIRRTR